MEDIRAKAEEWNASTTKKVPYEFVEFCEGKRSVKASGKYCEWVVHDNESALVKIETSCRDVIGFTSFDGMLQKFVFCPYCGKKIKLMKGKTNG